MSSRIAVTIIGASVITLGTFYLLKPNQFVNILRRGPGARGEPTQLPGCVRVGFCLLLVLVGIFFVYKAIVGEIPTR
jgi:hypothetical protein